MIKERYLNLFTDFGFKRVFGQEAQRDLLADRDLHNVVDTAFAEGISEGKKMGIEEGEKIGLEKGEQIGMEKGEQIGMKKGEQRKAQATARHLKRLGVLSSEQIADATGLSISEVEALDP